MQSYSEYYSSVIDYFDCCVNDIFGEKMIKIEEIRGFEHMGSFTIKYMYIPNKMLIQIENEIRTFGIYIYDENRAHNSLRRIKDYDSSLSKSCIRNALILLKEVLYKNKFDLYYSIGEKIYKKNYKGDIKRIKDLKELL